MTAGAKSKSMWRDPVKRAQILAKQKLANERKAAGLGLIGEEPHQVRAGPVGVEAIPRDPVEMAIFGGGV